MAVLHYEDGYSKEYLTSNGTSRLFGYIRNQKRPIRIELSIREWNNPEFHYRFALYAVHPTKGEVVLNEDLT